jgi:hypothetical protein
MVQDLEPVSDTTTSPTSSTTRTVVGMIVLAVMILVPAALLWDPQPAVEEPATGDPPAVGEPTLPRSEGEPPLDEDGPDPEALEFDRFLYSDASIMNYRSAMSGEGPFYEEGDAGHGGPRSPGDGRRAEELAQEFLAAPNDSYWSQSDLPFAPGASHPAGMEFVRPMHAAWVLLTQPEHPQREDIEDELRKLLLAHARDETLDFSDSSKYPPDFHGSAQNPIFEQAQWLTRLIKARDMLGRTAFDEAENLEIDQWLYGYANWTANWMHQEAFGPHIPGRLDRDYNEIAERWFEDNSSSAYDGAPTMSSAARQYTNRHAAVASTMSLAANYLKHYEYGGTLASTPSYEVYSIDELLDHSRLFVEETLRFSVFPEGFQGDFGRSSQDGNSPRTGWLYAINVLANLVEMAEYHAQRGDMSVWEYGTIDGVGNSAGAPTEGGFGRKNLHFFAWAMVRYVNDDWGRRFEGERLADPDLFHDVIPVALAHRFAPEDELLEAAWRRDGRGFADYEPDTASQGPFPAELGEGAKSIGLIEQANALPIEGNLP